MAAYSIGVAPHVYLGAGAAQQHAVVSVVQGRCVASDVVGRHVKAIQGGWPSRCVAIRLPRTLRRFGRRREAAEFFIREADPDEYQTLSHLSSDALLDRAGDFRGEGVGGAMAFTVAAVVAVKTALQRIRRRALAYLTELTYLERMMLDAFYEGFDGRGSNHATAERTWMLLVAEYWNGAEASPTHVGVCEIATGRTSSADGQSGVRPALRLAGLAVSPTHRRRGVARSMLAHCEALAAAWGYDELVLDVDATNKAAVALYTCAGYQQVSDTPWWTLDLWQRLQSAKMKRWCKKLAADPSAQQAKAETNP